MVRQPSLDRRVIATTQTTDRKPSRREVQDRGPQAQLVDVVAGETRAEVAVGVLRAYLAASLAERFELPMSTRVKHLSKGMAAKLSLLQGTKLQQLLSQHSRSKAAAYVEGNRVWGREFAWPWDTLMGFIEGPLIGFGWPRSYVDLAFIVGINRYGNNIPALGGAVKDAQAIATVLGGLHGYTVESFPAFQ